MGMRRFFLVLMAFMLSHSLLSKEIVVGVERLPERKLAVILTPIVLPDLISAKAAFEYRLHRKFSLVIPVEAKWMDYRAAIKLGARVFNAPRQDVPEAWYEEDARVRPMWNINFAQFKLSTGIGAKWFPFSESMTSGFFVKSTAMVGFERFNDYNADLIKDSAVITSVVTIGYNWVKRNGFTFGFEVGEEYTWHTNPIEGLPPLKNGLPMLISGFMPLFHLSLGFTI